MSTVNAAKKDKQKVTDEIITDEIIEQFFDLQAPAGVDVDYHMLERAYRGLNAPDFARFVELFASRGKNLNAQGEQGTLLEVLATHQNGNDYAEVIKRFS